MQYGMIVLKPSKLLVFSIVGGIIVTLITGLIQNAPYLMGATYFGYPFSWLVDVHGAPPNFDIYKLNHARYLIADIVIWAIIAGLIIYGISKSRKK